MNKIEMPEKKNHILSRKKFNHFRSHFTVFSVQAVINFGTAGSPKVLLLKRKEEPSRGEWWIPGGVVFKTEDSRHAVLRIIKRETCLQCRIVKQLYFARETYRNVPDVSDGIADYISEIFLLETVDKNTKIRLDKTSSGYKFITKIDKSLHRYVKKYLKDTGIFSSH